MRYSHPIVIDQALEYIRANCDKMVLLSTGTSNYTEANSTYNLGEVSMTSSDFTIGNGVESGRQVIIAEKNSVPVSQDGTGTHFALLDTANSRVLHVTPSSEAAVSELGSFNASSWRVEIQDPIAVGA